MYESLIRFADAEWTDLASGAREKRVKTAKSILRIVEFSSGFIEHDWCCSGQGFKANYFDVD